MIPWIVSETSAITLPCTDLAEAIEFFTRKLDCRLDAIFPADDPRWAELSREGTRIRLERSESSRRASPGAWVEGRAGMLYRDLAPERLGGQVIASHIKIPKGGEVPDYVHFHDVRLQLIYCRKGWVKVVYEDQGPAFVLAAGDAVLQPPGIRHRVLEASPGLEVLEVSSPAEHVTRVDHALALPNAGGEAGRRWGGQRFVRHVARDAKWVTWRAPGFVQRDLGVEEASEGLASAVVVKRRSPFKSIELAPLDRSVLWIVLEGGVVVREAAGVRTLGRDEAHLLAPGCEVELEAWAEAELLEVVLPVSP